MSKYVNKEYYRQLAPDDRSFLNLTAQNIKAVMDRLNAENIKFSATIGYRNAHNHRVSTVRNADFTLFDYKCRLLKWSVFVIYAHKKDLRIYFTF